MAFDERGFAKAVVTDLGRMKSHMETFKALPPETRKAVIKRIMNALVDIPYMPELLEGMMFAFAVEAFEHFFKSKFGQKEEKDRILD